MTDPSAPLRTSLHIADNLSLPVEAVTQTFGILAKRGSGKTYAALVMAEEMLKAGQQVVIVDPVGVCWGLRTSADGLGPGLPIVIAGGEHGDIPLERESGDLLADLVVDERFSLVLDFSLLRKGAQRAFMTAFAETLYHRNRQPLHLILDEADAYCPQRPMRDEARLVGAMEDIVRRGRARGLGVTMVTQRPAVINKDVLTQIECLIALRTVGKPDIEAVDAWVRVYGDGEHRAELLGSIASLDIGEAWFWSPGWLGIFKRIRIRQRETFDSSATPEVGAVVVTPAARAEVDLDSIRARIEATIERKKQADPALLRRRIAELERQLKAGPEAPVVQTVVEVERVEVPVISDEVAGRLEAAVGKLHEGIGELVALRADLRGEIEAARKCAALGEVMAGKRTPGHPPGVRREVVPATNGHRKAYEAHGDLKQGQRRMLEALARRYPMVLTAAQLATLSRLTVSGGTYQSYLTALRVAGYVVERDGGLAITDAALALIGSQPVSPQTAGEVRAMWRETLPVGAQRMFDALVDAWPAGLSRAELGDAAGLESRGGTFGSYLGTLRRNGLVDVAGDEIRAAEVLFEEVNV